MFVIYIFFEIYYICYIGTVEKDKYGLLFILHLVYFFFEIYYICYIVGIIENDTYSLLEYENVKYLLFIPINLVKKKHNNAILGFSLVFSYK